MTFPVEMTIEIIFSDGAWRQWVLLKVVTCHFECSSYYQAVNIMTFFLFFKYDYFSLLCNWSVKKCLLSVLLYTLQTYRQVSNIWRTLVGNKIVGHSDVVGASPVGAAPTTSSFSTKHLASLDWAKIIARRDEKHLSLGFGCVLY